MRAFGIDVGGSGIKGAYVNLETGDCEGDRHLIPTPTPATPAAVGETIAKLLDQAEVSAQTPIGVAFPAPLRHGMVRFMANLDQSWVGANLTEVVRTSAGRSVVPLNDADAAGYAEVAYGAAKGKGGLVVATTLGTGIGTALIHEGKLIPNTELGHIEIDGVDAETRTSAAARTREELGWDQWAERLQKYYSALELLLTPDLFIVGGGVSQRYEHFLPLLDLQTPIIPAQLRNDAGIVGAAYLARLAQEGKFHP
ncbi:MAG: ROK family protein [Actinomycetaceae bacterium]|nr:ROK family protein [Actinomycetaceae bacterium]